MTLNGVISLFCFFCTEFDRFTGFCLLCHSGWRYSRDHRLPCFDQNMGDVLAKRLLCLAKTDPPCSVVSLP